MSCQLVIIYSSVISNIIKNWIIDNPVEEGMSNLYFRGIFNVSTARKRSPRLEIMGGHLPEVQLQVGGSVAQWLGRLP